MGPDACASRKMALHELGKPPFHRDGYRHGGKVDRSDPSQWVLNGRTTESNRQVSNPTILFTVTVQVFSVSFSVNPLNLPTTQKPLSRRRTWPRNQSP